MHDMKMPKNKLPFVHALDSAKFFSDPRLFSYVPDFT